MRPGRTCSIEDCNETAYCRGWCSTHYTRWRKNGDPLRLQPTFKGKPCTVSGCDEPNFGRGLCMNHYALNRKYGRVDKLPQRTAEERFTAKVHRAENGCWTWLAERDRDGYGYFWAERRRHRAHRWSYEYFVGPIPLGLEVDHLCGVRSCVNPEHLEPVTQAENVRRARARLSAS